MQIYSVTKEEYDSLKTEKNKLDYTRFRNLLNYFGIERIRTMSAEEKKKIRVWFAIRETKINESSLSTSNIDFIKKATEIDDGEWVFTKQDDDEFKVKLPAFYGILFFNETKLLIDYPIEIKNRRDVDSEKFTDNFSRTRRLCIREEDRNKYYKLAELTYSNLRRLVKDEKLLQKCKKHQLKYSKYKKGENYSPPPS